MHSHHKLLCCTNIWDDFDAKMNKFKHKMVFMNFWYIKHYGARVGDDFVAKNN